MIEPIVIGIGGNIGSEQELIARFDRAREAIGMLGGHLRAAPLYRTAPIGPLQAPFLNTALRIAIPDAQPGELIAALLEIERLLGRERFAQERNGPRMVDLDLLIWGTREIRSSELEVPHPRLHERRFALEPAHALLGDDFEVPGRGRLATLLERVRHQAVEQIAERW